MESRSNGTNGIIEILPDGSTKDRLAEHQSASTSVYEYGGLPYAIIPSNENQPPRIIFSDSKDKSLNLLRLDTDEDRPKVATLQKFSTLRYADFDVQPLISGNLSPWVLAVEEDHEKPKPADVKNYIVAINVAEFQVKRVVEGADFYMYPCFSPDGKKIAWKEWNHPDMPWQGCKLYWADWDDHGAVSNVELVAGENGQSVSEPRWSPDGKLFYCQEKTNFRQLYWKKPGDSVASSVTIPGLEKAEVGDASFFIGCQNYVFLDQNTIIAAPCWSGAYELVHIDLLTSTMTVLDTPLKDHRFDSVARLSSTAVLVKGAGYTTAPGIYTVTVNPDSLSRPTVRLVHSSTDVVYPSSLFSTPIPISFPSTKGNPPRTVTGFFWPPHNPSYTAPEDTLPPLLISPHGGPTAHTGPGLKLMDQYFTSRGYSCFSINYTGSSGHGKAYREALYGRWGIADTDDVADAVSYLASQSLINPKQVGVVGGSAGGYNVLQSLVHYPSVFAGGVCFCGVSDVAALDVETHKMESRYMEVLMGFDENTTQEEKDRVYKERSPLYRAEEIKAPLLLVHGDEDRVVPISQSYEVKKRMEGAGGTVEMIVLKGEGHMFKRGDSWRTVVEDGEKWWRKSLLGRDD